MYESRNEPGRLPRILSLACITVLVVADAVSLVLLVRGVFAGSQLQPPVLLFTGLALWLVNVAVFALLYWELDGGGPEARADGYAGRYPDFVFPQHQADQEELAPRRLEAVVLRLPLRLAHQRDRVLPDRRDAVLPARQARHGRGEPALLRHAGRHRGARREHRPRLTPCAGRASSPAAVRRHVA